MEVVCYNISLNNKKDTLLLFPVKKWQQTTNVWPFLNCLSKWNETDGTLFLLLLNIDGVYFIRVMKVILSI